MRRKLINDSTCQKQGLARAPFCSQTCLKRNCELPSPYFEDVPTLICSRGKGILILCFQQPKISTRIHIRRCIRPKQMSYLKKIQIRLVSLSVQLSSALLIVIEATDPWIRTKGFQYSGSLKAVYPRVPAPVSL